jgi:crossover junction endodeoxyribonuclease RuvC
MKVIGLDPGLRATGWGVIHAEGNRLRHVANGTIRVKDDSDMATRLARLYRGLQAVMEEHMPDEAAVEEVFVNRNPSSTLKLGQARGIVMLVPALARATVFEYPANLVKKSVVGSGHASKDQVAMMVRTLLPTAQPDSSDAADALAVAICHAHHRSSLTRWTAAAQQGIAR